IGGLLVESGRQSPTKLGRGALSITHLAACQETIVKRGLDKAMCDMPPCANLSYRRRPIRMRGFASWGRSRRHDKTVLLGPARPPIHLSRVEPRRFPMRRAKATLPQFKRRL